MLRRAPAPVKPRAARGSAESSACKRGLCKQQAEAGSLPLSAAVGSGSLEAVSG
jgi:hypothetical protein